MAKQRIIQLSANPEGFGQTPDELSPDLFVSNLPLQNSHEYYEDEDLGLYVGVWDTTDMIETAGPYACDEFMWLLEGEAAIKNRRNGRVEKAHSGQAFVIPRAYDCQWHQAGYLRKFYVIYEGPHEPGPASPVLEGIIIPNPEAPVENLYSAESLPLFSDSANWNQQICYKNGPGSFLVGTGRSGPFASATRPLPCHLFACVIEGSVALSDPSDESFQFKAGDAFFIPSGLNCQAQIDDNLSMIFCMVKTANLPLET